MKAFQLIISSFFLLLFFVCPQVAWAQQKWRPPWVLKAIEEQSVSARQAKVSGELLKARELWEDLLAKYPDLENASAIREELRAVDLAIVYSGLVTEQSILYEVQPADTLGKLAYRFGTTIELIKKRNNLTSNLIRIGQKLSIWRTPFEIVVDKSDNTLTLTSAGRVVRVYPVSTGKNNSTPAGQFTILHRLIDPVWYHKKEVIQPKTPENFLGTRWLGFDKHSYGIHGTIQPELIGKQVSSGCVRMRNEDVEELFDLIPQGTKVTIIE